MALIDYMLELVDEEAISTSSGGAGVMGTALDLTGGVTQKDGWGNTILPGLTEGKIFCNFVITETVVGPTALTFSLGSDAAVTSADLTSINILASVTLFDPTPEVGNAFSFIVPSANDLERYVQFYHAVTGTASAGKVSAWLDNKPADSSVELKA